MQPADALTFGTGISRFFLWAFVLPRPRRTRLPFRRGAGRRARTATAAARYQRGQHQRERQELAAQTRQAHKPLTAQARQRDQSLAVVQSLWALKATQAREAL
jgi:hypothetical protein